MKMPFTRRFRRKLRRIFCIRHDWQPWINGQYKSCKKCDKKVRIWK